jgi:phospholipase D-like protein
VPFVCGAFQNLSGFLAFHAPPLGGMRVLIGKGRVLQRIRGLARRRHRAPVLCAVSFVGTAAVNLTGLRGGDVLVVNLSKWALARGLTNPHELEKFLHRGVAIYCDDRLHAKAFAFHDVLIVGSANASDASNRTQIEAALETTSSAAVGNARAWISSFSRLVTQQEIDDAKADYHRPSRVGGGTRETRRSRPGPLRNVPRLFIAGVWSDFDSTDWRLTKGLTPVVEANHGGQGYSIDVWSWDGRVDIKTGDALLFLTGRSEGVREWCGPPHEVVAVYRKRVSGHLRVLIYGRCLARLRNKRYREAQRVTRRAGFDVDGVDTDRFTEVTPKATRDSLLRLWR